LNLTVTFPTHTEASTQQVFEPYGGTPFVTEASPSTIYRITYVAIRLMVMDLNALMSL